MQQETDTEITLGTGKMLVLFFGLVLLCALFFGMGFTMGKNSVRSAPELLATPSGARPSAANQTTQAPAPQAQMSAPANSAPADNGSAGANPPAQQAPANSTDQNAQAGQSGTTAQGTASGPGYFVQVAAVSKQEDADALKGHQYQAFVAAAGADKLFHVQVGPFADIKDAEATRAKLVADGYNPILKK